MSQMGIETLPDQLRENNTISSLIPTGTKQAWTNGTCVSTLSDEIFQRLQRHKKTAQKAGEYAYF
jgi:hypothetical protein